MEKINNSKVIDGMDNLLCLFGNNQEEFLHHFFANIQFFKPESIEKQKNDFKEKINLGEPFTVRYTLKAKKYFQYENSESTSGFSKKSFKNKSDAGDFAKIKNLIHNDTKLNVLIDKDGNYDVRKQIFDTTNYKVSQGAISNIKNYMICHVWGETHNPLFFTSLWNIVLIPHYISFLTDKPDENSILVRRLKDILKILCIKIYKPQNILNELNADYDASNIFGFADIKTIEEKKHSEFVTEFAENLINKKLINFIEKRPDTIDLIEDKSTNNTEVKQNIDNKDFVIEQLSKLSDLEEDDFINVLTDAVECKNKFNIAFPVLKLYNANDDKVFEDNTGRSRYYKNNTFFVFNDQKYIICNHWYPKQRELFELWAYMLIS